MHGVSKWPRDVNKLLLSLSTLGGRNRYGLEAVYLGPGNVDVRAAAARASPLWFD